MLFAHRRLRFPGPALGLLWEALSVPEGAETGMPPQLLSDGQPQADNQLLLAEIEVEP